MIDALNPNELFDLLDQLEVDSKLVNEDIIIYPEGYTTNTHKGTYISLARLSEEDEDGHYTEATLSYDFEIYPESKQELLYWLKEFKKTGKMPNYIYD